MKQENYGFWPNTFIQWTRVIIAMLGIVVCLAYVLNYLEFNYFIGLVTFLGFIGYLIESLNTNIEERKNQIKNKK